MQSASTPILRSAFGSDPVTSARPPVLANGTISEDAMRPLMAASVFPLPGQLAEKLGSLLGGSRVDVEPGTPFEPGDFRELRHDFDVPMIELGRPGLEGGTVDDEVERGVLQSKFELAERTPENGRERPDLFLLDHLVRALGARGDHPCVGRR